MNEYKYQASIDNLSPPEDEPFLLCEKCDMDFTLAEGRFVTEKNVIVSNDYFVCNGCGA